MRLVLFADIHGNLPAFEAALKHAATLSPDLMVICGDIVNAGPDSRACWDLAHSLGCPLLRGNHERYVFDYGTPEAPAEWASERFAPVRWSASQFTPEERAAMRAMPIRLRLPDVPDVLFVHASARDDYDHLISHTQEEKLSVFFPEVQERVIVRGHNHNQMVRPWNDKVILTIGAIGLPLDHNPTAQYLTLDRRGDEPWQFTHWSVPYDLDAVRDRFRNSGYLREAGPMARLLLREALTASPQVLPFLWAYRRWSPDGSLPLDEALARWGGFGDDDF